MNQEPILTLNLEVEDVNKILTGLNYYKLDIDNLSQKIVQISQTQIDEHNKKVQEQTKETENKKEKTEGNEK